MLDQHVPSTSQRPMGRRLGAFSLYGIALALFITFVGLPTDIIAAFGWLWLATICWRIDRPRKDHLNFVLDWLPLAIVLSLYDLTRGFADNGAEPHVQEMIDFDRWIMGGSDLPTHWLQHHFYDAHTVYWWDLAVSLIYFSHFIVTPIVAVVLWLRNREQWGRFTRRWIGLSIAGLTTYFLFPAAPPWWAATHHLIDPVNRISTRGWSLVGMRTAGHLLNVAQGTLSNPIAAMPSLHSAFSLLVVAFFLPRVRRRWWPLLISYPIAMAAALVYSGEHWIIDAIVGFAYVGIVFIVVKGCEQAWIWWRSDRTLSA